MEHEINIHELLQLAAVPGVGNGRLKTLINHFSTPRHVLDASPIDLIKVQGVEKKLASSIHRFREGARFADEQLSRLNKLNGRVITIWDEAYPASLKNVFDPPVLLFVQGELTPEDQFAIAVVGTRRPSPYGKLMTERISGDLAAIGITVISGLARGIDTIAHQTALQSKGRTVAVIGSALDHVYPAENKKLSHRIIEQGALVSEFYMGTKPDPGNFPRRNRIVSGLSLGVVIIESDVDGGAMITGNMALDQNRELFCIPGPVTSKYSQGTNELIKSGNAKLVQSTQDIIDELRIPLRPIIKTEPKKIEIQVSVFEQKILDVLSYEPIHIDTISERSGLSTADSLVHLLGLEFKGLVRQFAGKMFRRSE